MNRRSILAGVVFSAVFVLLGCDNETRDGELVLSGATPVRIVDEGGKTVEFVSGPVKAEFSVERDHKFTVTMTQGENKQAKFSGRAPQDGGSWNFTLRGKEIGQPVDLASTRSLELYGKTWREIREGSFCGRNGRWLMEEEYQRCNEDWKVAFADAETSQDVGAFRSRREGLRCLLASRYIYCREESFPPQPIPPRPLSKAEDAVKTITRQAADGIKFD